MPPASRAVLDWLLEPSQPSVRYRTLARLRHRGGGARAPRPAPRQLGTTGWGATVLAARQPGGWWVGADSLYTPKYRATTWQMLVLADLGFDRTWPAVRASCELWMRGFATRRGGLGGNSQGTPHYCLAANMARALIQLGYVDDPRIARTLEWLAEVADPKGGWSCFGTGRNLDSWEALSAFAVYPRDRWTVGMRRAVEGAVEFFLERELHRQGARYAPWYRFHYPVHYYYDLLVGLDCLTALGCVDDRRLGYALQQLREKRRRDGRWNLDAVHPDVEGALAAWYAAHPARRPAPLGFERPGRPSKEITLRALTILDRLGE